MCTHTTPVLTKVVSDIRGAEGPVFDRTGRLFCVCPSKGQVLLVEDQHTREHANTQGAPAGLAIDRENNLWVADMKLGILKIPPNGGRVDKAVTEFDQQPIRGCNDLAFDCHGNLYFTAPAGSSAENRVGEVFRLSTTGKLTQIDRGYAFSNGLALNATGDTLIVAETMTKSLWSYRVGVDGEVRNKHLFAKMPGEHAVGADGMDFDSQGHLVATNWGGKSLDLFDPFGSLIERIMLPFNPSNVHFGGEGLRTLYITEHTNNGLWHTPWPFAGHRDWGLG